MTSPTVNGLIFEQRQEQVWFLNKSKALGDQACVGRSLSLQCRVWPGWLKAQRNWESSEAGERQTGAVHTSASACWDQLTHAGTETGTSTVHWYRDRKLLQQPALPLHVSPVSSNVPPSLLARIRKCVFSLYKKKKKENLGESGTTFTLQHHVFFSVNNRRI